MKTLENIDAVVTAKHITDSLGLRAWNGSAAVTTVAKRWNGTAWQSIQ